MQEQKHPRPYQVALGLLFVFLVYSTWKDQGILSQLASKSTEGVEYSTRSAAHTTMSITTDWAEPFCQPWSALDAMNRSLQPFDLWHTHHPNWIVTREEEHEFCVEPMDDQSDPVIRNMMLFYVNQFYSSCKVVIARFHWGSGWGADFWNVNVGLIHALERRVPLIMTSWGEDNREFGIERTHPWIYAANKKDHGKEEQPSLVCEAGDTTCYFLPYHGCGPHDALKND
jgi:hypothetical protein